MKVYAAEIREDLGHNTFWRTVGIFSSRSLAEHYLASDYKYYHEWDINVEEWEIDGELGE